MKPDNPFLTRKYFEHWTGPTTAEDRTAMVTRFTVEQCKSALQVPGLQKSVQTAIERRQRKLAKA